MPNWKFTDQYGTAYPALKNSILSLLVFDVPEGTSPVNGTAFSSTLDLTATGNSMNALASLTGMTTIPITGTVQEANNTLSVALLSSNDAEFTAAIAKNIPIVGGKICQKAQLAINNVTPKSLTENEDPTTDEIDLKITIAVGQSTGTLISQIPMADGLFSLTANFTNFGIGLSDLDFLVPGDNNFTSKFPAKDLGPYYNNETKLELIQISATLFITTKPALSIMVSTVTAVIGLTNIPVYEKAVYLNPLGVWITISNPTTKPTPSWGLLGSIILCNYQTPGNTENPDFEFDFEMGFPNPPTQPNFSISASFENPMDKPVSLMLQDLLGGQTNTGIDPSITIEKFTFDTIADVTTGTISQFDVALAMKGQFGIFKNFTLEEFSISVAYSN